jgi:hypothetical protein
MVRLTMASVLLLIFKKLVNVEKYYNNITQYVEFVKEIIFICGVVEFLH